MSEIQISVVVPMYNSENTIIRTLDSVKAQTALDRILEIIIINDGSTDNSLNEVKKYKKNNSLPINIIDKENEGVSASRNLGMEKSTGNWIAFLDSDDEWIPKKIEIQTDLIGGNSNIDFLGGNTDNGEFKILFKKIDHLYKATVFDMCIRSFPQPSTVIFKKEIFENIGGFDENQSYCEDANYFIKICNKYNVYHYPKQLIIFDGGKFSYGASGLSSNLKKMHEGTLKNIKEFKDLSIISNKFYLFLWFFYWLKYFRREFINWKRNF
jgi:glycosyltransferase involved in cell wall biosynthesis